MELREFVDAGALMTFVLLATIDEGLAGAFIGHPDDHGWEIWPTNLLP